MDDDHTLFDETEWRVPKPKRIQRKEKPHINQQFQDNTNTPRGKIHTPQKFHYSKLSSVQEYQISYGKNTSLSCKQHIQPQQKNRSYLILIKKFPVEILALISEFFWTVPKERDNKNFSFVENLPSGKIVCMMLKLGLCSRSLLQFVSKKYSTELDTIRETSILNFIQTLRMINIDLKKGFDGSLNRSSLVYHQLYSLNPKVPLKKVYDCIQKRLLHNIDVVVTPHTPQIGNSLDAPTTPVADELDYSNLLSKLWYTSCFYDPSLAKHFLKNQKSLTLEHYYNGLKLGICAGKSYIVAHLLNNVIHLSDYNIIFDGLRDSISCPNKRISEIISKYIIKTENTEDFWSDQTIRNFFACYSWTEKSHIENLCGVVKEFGIYTLFRLGKNYPNHIFTHDYNCLVKIITSSVKLCCDSFIRLIVKALNTHLDMSSPITGEVDLKNKSSNNPNQNYGVKLTIENYKLYIRGNPTIDSNTQELFLLRVILKEGILSACSEGNLYMFNVLNPIKILGESDIYECWKALHNGRIFGIEFQKNDPKTGFASRFILDLFSLTTKLIRVNFIPSFSSQLTNLIFDVLCYKFETMIVLMNFPDFDISFRQFAIIEKALKISEERIIKQIFETKKSQLTRFFSTISDFFFDSFTYSGEKNDLEIFLMFLSDPRMRLTPSLENKFKTIYGMEKTIPYTLAIIQIPHLCFELFFGEFIMHHPLNKAPNQIISALINHKKIYQTYNFESMIGNLLLDTSDIVIKNLEFMIGL